MRARLFRAVRFRRAWCLQQEGVRDQINLVGIIDDMRRLEYFLLSDVPSVVSAIVRNKVRRLLTPPPPTQTTREREGAAKQATAAANRRIVEQKIELGRQLATLRDAIPSNQKFGRAVRKQFDLHDPLHVAEMARVARLYGARPEIYGAVGWRALVELASSTTPVSVRLGIEVRILAGECLNGAEIIRARA
jgi:hypothetical protein